jgi:hypothetical protein
MNLFWIIVGVIHICFLFLIFALRRTGFSLWGLILARTKFHGLKLVLLNPAFRRERNSSRKRTSLRGAPPGGA